MAGRFGEVKFNFMRAVEMFEDLNSIDMDVQAPPSSRDYFKEKQLAEKLNEFLNQLIEDGFFDDCESRDASPLPSDEEEAEDENEEENEDEDGEVDEEPESQSEVAASYDSGRSTPRSAGFDYHSDSRSEGSGRYASSGSRGSFSDRFKRYIRRIIPGSRRSK